MGWMIRIWLISSKEFLFVVGGGGGGGVLYVWSGSLALTYPVSEMMQSGSSFPDGRVVKMWNSFPLVLKVWRN